MQDESQDHRHVHFAPRNTMFFIFEDVVDVGAGKLGGFARTITIITIIVKVILIDQYYYHIVTITIYYWKRPEFFWIPPLARVLMAASRSGAASLHVRNPRQAWPQDRQMGCLHQKIVVFAIKNWDI